MKFTKQVVYLNDEDVAVIHRNNFTLKNIQNSPVSLTITNIDLEIGQLDKGDFDHFMLKAAGIEDTKVELVSFDGWELENEAPVLSA